MVTSASFETGHCQALPAHPSVAARVTRRTALRGAAAVVGGLAATYVRPELWSLGVPTALAVSGPAPEVVLLGQPLLASQPLDTRGGNAPGRERVVENAASAQGDPSRGNGGNGSSGSGNGNNGNGNAASARGGQSANRR